MEYACSVIAYAIENHYSVHLKNYNAQETVLLHLQYIDIMRSIFK